MSEHKRMQREVKTLQVMIGVYCHGRHGTQKGTLCDDCRQLQQYSLERLRRCRYQPDKPASAACPTHCYTPAMREGIRDVMRYAGPRMAVIHPLLVVFHLFDTLHSRRHG